MRNSNILLQWTVLHVLLVWDPLGKVQHQRPVHTADLLTLACKFLSLTWSHLFRKLKKIADLLSDSQLDEKNIKINMSPTVAADVSTKRHRTQQSPVCEWGHETSGLQVESICHLILPTLDILRVERSCWLLSFVVLLGAFCYLWTETCNVSPPVSGHVSKLLVNQQLVVASMDSVWYQTSHLTLYRKAKQSLS